MTIPTFDEIMYPLLDTIKDGETYNVSDISDLIRDKYFNLTDEEKKIRVSNGKTKFYDRLTWGRTYLKKAGLVEDPQRGQVKITQEGKNVLQSEVKNIDVKFLTKYSSFRDFKDTTKKKENSKKEEKKVSENLSPTDLIDLGFDKVNSSLKQDLLEKLKNINPYYFEKVILDLLHQMGYGDFIETSKSGDGGIDGIINEDELGLEKIYIQCKRFSSSKVREPDIRNFIGAMSSESTKGIFVTTSDFDQKAVEKAKIATHKIILIDGEKLVDLMIKYNVGVQSKTHYIVKEIDLDFFVDE